MAEIRCTTQEELDAALAREDVTYETHKIIICSPAGVWITLHDSRGLAVRAYDTATVWALDSATVEAWDSATVLALDSATVEAWDSATVLASGTATVRAYDTATVRASGSATVEAWDSATVRASGSATVRARDNATVRAYDTATVEAWDSATVRAGSHVAVHLCSARATVTGGVIIDVANLDLTDPATWAAYAGVDVDDQGRAHLYKAVDAGLCAGHQRTLTHYPLGETITDPQWRDDNNCGGGLHTCPTPWQARDHYPDATRFLEVTVPLAELRPIDSTKAKSRTVTVLREVDLNGNPC